MLGASIRGRGGDFIKAVIFPGRAADDLSGLFATFTQANDDWQNEAVLRWEPGQRKTPAGLSRSGPGRTHQKVAPG